MPIPVLQLRERKTESIPRWQKNSFLMLRNLHSLLILLAPGLILIYTKINFSP